MSIASRERSRPGVRAEVTRRKPVEAAKPLLESMATGERQLASLLDEVQHVLESPSSNALEITAAVDQLFRGLQGIRHSSSSGQWQELIRIGRSHPILSLVHQDPFTYRAFSKPRGYAGDAVMMDYIYGREEDWPAPVATPLGAAIFDYTTSAPASAGVRERRCVMAEMLDHLARERDDQHVLSVAAGHLREASLSCAVRRRRFSRFVAMDADQQSLQEIGARYGRFGIEPLTANIRRLLTGRLEIGTFDFVYTTGLYDYLVDSTAQRLTSHLFDRVRPGGRLVIANFLPNVRDVGYMEMFMDWHLVYRTRSQMLGLADDISQSSVEEVRILAERNENVVMIEITKR